METSFWVVVGALAVAGAVLWLVGALAGEAGRERARMTARLATLEQKVDAVIEHLGVVVPEQRHPEVVRLLADGQRIAAIKRYRELTGADLVTAKRAVDELAHRP